MAHVAAPPAAISTRRGHRHRFSYAEPCRQAEHAAGSSMARGANPEKTETKKAEQPRFWLMPGAIFRPPPVRRGLLLSTAPGRAPLTPAANGTLAALALDYRFGLPRSKTGVSGSAGVTSGLRPGKQTLGKALAGFSRALRLRHASAAPSLHRLLGRRSASLAGASSPSVRKR